MARKTKSPAAAPAPDSMSRVEWALAFERRVDELRPDIGRKYLATIVATLWPKHHADDPERVAAQWGGKARGALEFIRK